MDATDGKSASALGFLTVVDDPQRGLIGGYLVVNRTGRPLEFHCTCGVKPNRIQRILYGPTLNAYLYGEQLGRSLVGHAKARPWCLCTDSLDMLEVRGYVPPPVVLVLANNHSDATPANDSSDNDTPQETALHTLQVGMNRLAFVDGPADERASLLEKLKPVAEVIDLTEPFLRIREAIAEAQRGAA